MTRLISALVVLSFLASCGSLRNSRLNPGNWFGKSRAERIVATAPIGANAEASITDPRPLVDQVISLKVDRLPGGAIIHAMGLPVTQGYYGAELVALNKETPDKGVLSYEFRIVPPAGPAVAGTKPSREVLVGHFVSSKKLVGVRRITVIAAQNRRSSRR